MHTSLDCLPCFCKQVIKAGRLASRDNQQEAKKLFFRFCQELTRLDLSLCPPAVAGQIYSWLSQWTNCPDPFAEQKKEVNSRVMDILPRLQDMLKKSNDPLALALHLAIIGNYIDAGIDHGFDWEEALGREKQSFDYASTLQDFRSGLGPGKKAFILGDNAGEIGLDTLLVKEIQRTGSEVTYVVRRHPIINDATLQDAREVGMDQICRVISSGTPSPGTVLSQCSREFIREVALADLIISKGQGNFEALHGPQPRLKGRSVFFAFKVKCGVVAQMVGQAEGSSVFVKRSF